MSVSFPAPGHFEHMLGNFFARGIGVSRSGELTTRLLNLVPSIIECLRNDFDGLRIKNDRTAREFQNLRHGAPPPKLFQLYFHKDRGLTNSMIERCIAANFDVLALTVDTITGGNRERDLRTGFTSPPRLTLNGLLSFVMHPRWAANYFMHEKFELPQLKDYVKEGSNISVSVGDYFSTMLDQSMNWQDAADVRKKWGKQFCLKGIMSTADAKRAVDIGATAIMVSNHGGRQLDGSRSPFDQLAEIVDAVGERIDVICDGGITRGTHVFKALSVGAKACSGGRLYCMLWRPRVRPASKGRLKISEPKSNAT